MRKSTFITWEEKVLPGSYRIYISVGKKANSFYCTVIIEMFVKPLIVYHTETSKSFFEKIV